MLKIAIIIYAAISGFIFIFLYAIALIGNSWEWMWPFILSSVILNALIITALSLNNPAGFVSWEPLTESKKCIVIARVVLATSALFLAINIIIIRYFGLWVGNEWKTKLSVMIFCSLFILASSIIGSGFAVGLNKVLPRWLLRFRTPQDGVGPH